MTTIAALDAGAYQQLLAQMGPAARCRRLAVECAFHTPLDAGALAAFAEAVPPAASDLAPSATLVSTLTGDAVEPCGLTPDYWARQVTEPVAFLDAVRTCTTDGPTVWAEIGAEAALLPLLRRILGEGSHDLAPATAWQGAGNEGDAVLALVDRLFAAAPDRVRPAGLAELAAMPQDCAIRAPYPFRREPHWLPTRNAAGHYGVPGAGPAPAVAAPPPRSAASAAPPAPVSERAAGMAETIFREVARACRREPTEVRPEHDFWVDLEFDSMMFVDLQLRLERALPLPKKVPFEAYARLRTVAELISLAETAVIEPEAIA
jgi:acyl transferase domain-containing protein